ncbi:GCN5-related N-acetyltransferase [Calothrix sp. NIES-4071]|nr:GCN5-related N-acetyltransferase [Calothrix sp. NIES-4071]BAZ62528.1 GCN5-related N-acetyltransferase [Calothrix sp. NIES-4105]
MPSFEYGKINDSGDASKLISILSQCFMMAPSDGEAYMQSVGKENFRVIRQNGKIAGGLAILSFGQCYGGEFVPMAGIAAVGIAPEYRGSGAALAMMQSAVKEIYEEQEAPISALFPAVQRLYRAAGYEQAGSFCNWEITTASIGMGKPQLPLTLITDEKDILRELHQKQARRHNGNLKRNEFIWADIGRSKDAQQYAYIIGGLDDPQGYIIFTQHRGDNNDYIYIRDWVLLTSAAVQSFWAFLGGHRSQINTVRYRSALVDALTLILPEQTAKLKSSTRWMLRAVDVKTALQKRGYPHFVEASLHLEVLDDFLSENNNKFILNVANGRADVTPGGKGDLKLDIRAFASLYTSLFSPNQLQMIGKLEATENAITTATQIFAGTSAWMADFF